MVDLKQLDFEFGDDWEIFEELLSDYSSVYEGFFERIEAACKSNDFEAVRIEAHTLKGIVANFYCADLKNKAKQIEECGGQKSLDPVPAYLEEFKQLNQAALAAIHAHIKKNAAA